MATATFVRNLDGFVGVASLYRLDPPLEHRVLFSDEPPLIYEYVVVSSVHNPLETLIFAANQDGEVTNWSALEGSSRGVFDHVYALGRAGYSTIEYIVKP